MPRWKTTSHSSVTFSSAVAADLFSPACERNKAPILEVLKQHLPHEGAVLELACGSLQHALHFTANFTELNWIPTDIDPTALAHGQQLNSLPANLARPAYLDVLELPWSVQTADAIYTANLLHISPAAVCTHLFAGGHAALNTGGLLIVYGPFKKGGRHTSKGNERFDADLRARNPAWGIRDQENVVETGASHGFVLQEDVRMPANNRMLIFSRTP